MCDHSRTGVLPNSLSGIRCLYCYAVLETCLECGETWERHDENCPVSLRQEETPFEVFETSDIFPSARQVLGEYLSRVAFVYTHYTKVVVIPHDAGNVALVRDLWRRCGWCTFVREPDEYSIDYWIDALNRVVSANSNK